MWEFTNLGLRDRPVLMSVMKRRTHGGGVIGLRSLTTVKTRRGHIGWAAYLVAIATHTGTLRLLSNNETIQKHISDPLYANIVD